MPFGEWKTSRVTQAFQMLCNFDELLTCVRAAKDVVDISCVSYGGYSQWKAVPFVLHQLKQCSNSQKRCSLGAVSDCREPE